MDTQKIRLSLVTLLLLAVYSCGYAQKNNQISPKEFSKAIAAEDAQVLDVRTPEEYEQEHIADAQNADWQGEHFDDELEGLNKTRPVYIYCRSGNRSAKAAAHMRKAGFTVYELKGGMTEWERELLLKAPVSSQEKEKSED